MPFEPDVPDGSFVPDGQLRPEESTTSKIKKALPATGDLGGPMVRGAIGAGEAIASQVSGIPAFVTSGVGKILGGGKVAMEGRVPTQQDYQQGADRATPQRFKDWTYDPATASGQFANEKVGEIASEAGKSFAKPSAAAMAGIEGLVKGKSLPEIKKLYEDNYDKLSPTSLAAFEVMLAGSLGAAGRGKPKAQEVPVVEPKNFRTQPELGGFVEDGSLAPPKPQIGAVEAGAGMSAAESQTGFRGSNRGGGMLPPEEVARIQKEIMDEVTRPDVQGDLFSKWRDENAFALDKQEPTTRNRSMNEPDVVDRQQEVGSHTPRNEARPGLLDQPIDTPTMDRPLDPTKRITREELNDVQGMGKVGDIITQARKERNEPPTKPKIVEDSIESTPEVRNWWQKWQDWKRQNARQGNIFSGRGGGERGAMYFHNDIAEAGKTVYKIAFNFLKSQWPRFSEVRDVLVLSKAEYEKAARSRGLDPSDTDGFFSHGSKQVILPEGIKDPKQIVVLLAHELRHGRDAGRHLFETGYWGKKGDASSVNGYLNIPAEKKAFAAEDAAARQFDKTFDWSTGKGPGKHQTGGINPEVFDSIVRTIKQVPKSMEHAKELLRSAIDRKYQSKDYTGIDRLEKMAQVVDKELGRDSGIISFRRGQGAKQGGWIGTFDKDIDKKGLVGTLMDFKKQFNVEKRPLNKVLEDEGIKADSLRDVASDDAGWKGRLDRLWESGMSNFEIDKTMSILAASKGPVGRIIKWAVDQRRQVTRDKDIRVREREQAMMLPWLKLSKEAPHELTEMKEKWIDNIGGRELSREDFRTDGQWKTFDAIQKVIREGWEAVNQARRTAGLKPIAYINNYFPAIREGNYWVRVVDTAGETKWAGAAKTTYGAQKIYDTIRKDFEGKEGLTVEKPFLRKKGQYDLANLSAFEETIRVLDKDDPVTRKIQQRYAELATSRGIGRTGLHRKGIPGALGFEKGDIGVRNAEKVLEHYIRRQEAYMANLKVGKLRSEFAELPKDIRDKMPIAEQWINEYFSHALGADLSKESTLRGITEALSEAGGLGREAPRSFIQELSGVASLLWLTNAKFVISQVVQPTLVLPKIMQMRGYDAKVANPIVAFWEGQRKWFTRDATSKGIVDWAAQNGYLDSSISALLDLKATDVRGQRWGALGAATRLPLAKLEKELVRGPVLLMFDEAIKDSVKDPKQRWEMAAEMMDYYMTHYDRESSPLMYNKMGMLGDMARPLKQYSHNNFGQFFEYVQDLKDMRSATPLATYMGQQALIGGLKGTILVAEATAIIAGINLIFGTEIPTPAEAMLKHGLPEWLIFGGLSTMLGVDVSSSIAAPGMPQMFSLAGPEFAYEALASVWPYLLKKAKGEESDADAMRALLAITPKAMHGWIEEAYTQPGGPVPNPRAEMQGKYRRSDEPSIGPMSEKDIARWLSLKTVTEAKANETVRITKELLKRDLAQKIDTLDAIASRVVNKQPIDPSLIQRFVKEGGNPVDLPKNIMDRLKSRSLTWSEEQFSKKTITPQQLHKLDVMKEFMDKNQETLTRPETKEESNFRKMGSTKAFNEPEGLVHADDGREASVISAHANYQRKEDSIDTTERRQMMAESKRLFPGDLKKQIKWSEMMMMRFEEEKAKVKTYGPRVPQVTNL